MRPPHHGTDLVLFYTSSMPYLILLYPRFNLPFKTLIYRLLNTSNPTLSWLLDLFVRLTARRSVLPVSTDQLEPRQTLPPTTPTGENPSFVLYVLFTYSLDQINNPDKMLSPFLLTPLPSHIKLAIGGTSLWCLLTAKGSLLFSRHDSINNSHI